MIMENNIAVFSKFEGEINDGYIRYTENSNFKNSISKTK